jgi:hypothetical protein
VRTGREPRDSDSEDRQGVRLDDVKYAVLRCMEYESGDHACSALSPKSMGDIPLTRIRCLHHFL